MPLTPYCAKCQKLGHWAADCPDKVVTNKPVVTNIPVTNVTNNVTKGDVERVLEWRSKNREKYNAYQKEWMRRKRGG